MVCCFVYNFKVLNFKSVTDPISIENSLSAEIGQVTNFRGLKLDRWPISVMEIGSLNGPLCSWGRIHDTSFSLQFSNKLECYITLSLKGLLGTNTLA
jgi:hypothetical protein